MNGDPLLVVDDVSVRFGGVAALDHFSMTVARGQIHGVIGPNGAGKTTLLNTVSGIYRPTEGQIRFEDRRIDGLRADSIARLGLARTFQNTQLFHGMSVVENVLVGLDTQRARRRGGRRRAAELLAYVGMPASDAGAGEMAFGQQRLNEIARALAIEPKLLLLDEPAGGMNDDEIDHMKRLLRALRDERGVTIVMVEHVMDLVMGVCDEVTVAAEGKRLALGTPDEVQFNADVLEAYLGEEHADARR